MSSEKGTRKLVGTEIPVMHGPATGAPFANPPSATFQMVGTHIDMPRTPTQQSPSANPKEGMRQDQQASKMPASKTPMKLISNLDPNCLPFSERAHKQSDVKD